MRSFLQRQPLLAALAAVAIALVVAIGVETGFGARLGASVPAGVSRPASPQELKLLPPLAAINADTQYPETTSRPLFVPLRRPAPPADVAQASAMKRGQFVLQGITIAGDIRIALLRDKSTGHIHRVEKGHELGGMKVAEVTPESVTLMQGNEQEVLPLQVLKPGPGGAVNTTGPFGGPAQQPQPIPTPPGAPQAAISRPGMITAPGSAANGEPHPDFGPAPNPAARAPGEAAAAPMSPEELLARRRARRAQQN
jgi:hypothetical protein